MIEYDTCVHRYEVTDDGLRCASCGLIDHTVTVLPIGKPRLTCARCQCDSGVDMPSVGHAEWRCEVCAMHARLAKLFDVLGTAGPFTEKWRDDMIALFADALAFVPKAVK